MHFDQENLDILDREINEQSHDHGHCTYGHTRGHDFDMYSQFKEDCQDHYVDHHHGDNGHDNEGSDHDLDREANDNDHEANYHDYEANDHDYEAKDHNHEANNHDHGDKDHDHEYNDHDHGDHYNEDCDHYLIKSYIRGHGIVGICDDYNSGHDEYHDHDHDHDQ